MSKQRRTKSQERDNKDVKDRRPRSGRNSSTRSFRNNDDRNTNHRDMVDTEVKPANDVAWYTKSMEQVYNSANISFMEALGTPLEPWDVQGAVVSGKESAPGVLRIGYIPTFGNPIQRDDPINVAMNKTYAWIRYYNSGSRNYDAPDYMKYLAVMDSAFAYAGFLIRTYGLANAYSSVNRFWPESFFSAMNVNFESIKHNLAGFRTYINNFISKVNSLAVPTSLPIFARHFWMCSNVYKDAESFWAQCYIHVPEVYCKYNTATSDVNFYKLHADGAPDLTYADLMYIGDDIIGSIMSSQDFYIMSGDTIKAFGEKVFRVNGITADYLLYPVYDAGVLNQIMSSFAMGDIVTETDESIEVPTANNQYVYSLYEDPNTGTIKLGYNDDGTYLPTTIEFAIPHSSSMTNDVISTLQSNFKELINLTVNDITPLHVIESTRVTAVPRQNARFGTNVYPNTADDAVVWGLNYCGADVYTTFQMFAKYNANGEVLPISSDYFSSVIWADTTGIQLYLLPILIELASFDWHPVLYPLSNSAAVIAHQPYVDVYRVALVTRDVLQRIHQVANLSLFDVTLENSIKLG